MSNIAIIGGGASGIIAAISAARQGAYVTIYEKNERIGKKILATGNGRCNLTNSKSCISDYHGEDTSFMQNTINTFWHRETIDFFSELGLLTKEEEGGKVYPYSDRATAVLDVLRAELKRCMVKTECKFDVSDIIKRKNAFEIVSYDGKHAFADKVIVSAGGKAAPNMGGGRSGYELLTKNGHHITELSPSIVQLKTDTSKIVGLKGIKCNASVRLGNNKYFGELLFTEYGVSGPPVFSLSSYYEESGTNTLEIDFFDKFSSEQIYRLLMNKIPLSDTLEDLFTGILHKNIASAIIKGCGFEKLSAPCKDLTSREIQKICDVSKCFKLKVLGTQSWNNAQGTKGGIKTDEVDSISFMSKKIDGLYITGEILDIDGNCGGYNLQWAWSSGYIAGQHAAQG